MNNVQLLRSLEERVTKLEAQVKGLRSSNYKPANVQKNFSYPRRVTKDAGKLLLRAFKEITDQLEFPDLKAIIDKARGYEGGEVVPVTVRSGTVHALIAEDAGMSVLWCNQRGPLESQDTSDDPRTIGRRNSDKLNGTSA